MMRHPVRTTALAAMLLLALAGCGAATKGSDSGTKTTAASGGGNKGTVRLGVVDFTEQHILGDVYAQALTAKGYKVEQKVVGSREIAEPALQSGQLDMLIEYAGSDVTYLTKSPPTDKDPQKVYQQLTESYQGKGITALQQSPMSDQQAITVTQATATKYGLKTLSDLAKAQGKFVMGGPPECKDRDTCFKGLQDVYKMTNVTFKPIAQGGLKYGSLEKGDIQVALSFTTDGAIAKQHLVVLEDDKQLFPPDNVVPVVRDDALSKLGPDFRSTVDKVSAALQTSEVADLNAKVDLEHQDAQPVAIEYAKSKGLG